MAALAPLVFAAITCLFLAGDVRRRAPVSLALWLVVGWLVVIGSRPVSSWFDPGSSMYGAAAAYDEGNPFERNVYVVLIIGGLLTLYRRGVRWRDVIGPNAWLFLFFLYWAFSILWAADSFLALKRLTKDFGNVVMVMVVLSDSRPVEAVKAALTRSACILIPMSVLFIRFFPQLGRTFHPGTGEMLFTGVTTHKNSLGALALVCIVTLVWQLVGIPQSDAAKRSMTLTIIEFSLLSMAAWLLLISGSATALGTTALGTSLVVVLRWQAVRARIRHIEIVAVVIGLGVWAVGGAQGILDYTIVDVLGRDRTLTTRTDLWPLLLSKADSVMFGSGFNSFWSGQRLVELNARLNIIQAHNGYLETYLNGGLTALALLGMVLLAAIRRINARMTQPDGLSDLAFAFVVVAVVYNITEASFDKTNILWFFLLLVIAKFGGQPPAGEPDTVLEAIAPPLSNGLVFATRSLPANDWSSRTADPDDRFSIRQD